MASPPASVPKTGSTSGTGVGSLAQWPAVSQQIKQTRQQNRETPHSFLTFAQSSSPFHHFFFHSNLLDDSMLASFSFTEKNVYL